MRARFTVLLGALLLVLASCQAAPSPEAPATLRSARASDAAVLKARMHDHDVIGASVRDAVAHADLVAARRHAKLLADFRIEGDPDSTWRKNLAAMSAAAQRVADAEDLTAASRDLAALARTCGDCHATLGGPHPVVGAAPGEDGASLSLRMQRHQWAAARAWDGLVVPDDAAWKAAARVLADAPLEPEMLTPGKRPTLSTRELAASMHELGRNAQVAEAGVDRGAIYGELIAKCSACHQLLGGGQRR